MTDPGRAGLGHFSQAPSSAAAAGIWLPSSPIQRALPGIPGRCRALPVNLRTKCVDRAYAWRYGQSLTERESRQIPDEQGSYWLRVGGVRVAGHSVRIERAVGLV